LSALEDSKRKGSNEIFSNKTPQYDESVITKIGSLPFRYHTVYRSNLITDILKRTP
jgi:hypothetical protein